MNEDIKKVDGRKNNGGARPGTGRPKTDKKYVSQNVRVPEDLMNEATEVGIVKGSFTKHFISGLKKEIKALKTKKK